MKIQYIRKLTASYMVLAQCEELQEWEKKMIAHAPKGNIVFAECVQENGEKYLWYNITGKQALDAVLETETFSYDMLCNVLNGIYEAVQQLEGMLLPAQSILLSAESIFVDYRTRQISFCYYPGNPMPLPEAFRTFMEYLLTRLDHSDERAVKAAYDIYGQSSAGGMELKELKSLLLMPYEKDEAKTEPEGLDDTEPEGSKAYATVGQKEQDGKRDASIWKQIFRGESTVQELLAAVWEKIWKTTGTAAGRPVGGAAGRLAGGAAGRPAGEKAGRLTGTAAGRPAGEKAGRVTGKAAASGDKRRMGRWKIGGNMKNMQKEPEAFVFEPEEEEHKSANPTVLLAGISQKPAGILRYEGTGGYSDLVIEKDNYVIGSAAECDGRIPSATVSRRHAKISKKGAVFFIEDLNSSNGTRVGGELLNYKTGMSLQKNEVVMFADEKFRFI